MRVLPMIGPVNAARTTAYALAFLMALAIACDLLWMPVQVADALGEILDASRSPSVYASFVESVDNKDYLRPLRIAQIKVLFDAAQGQHYWLVYRGFHALLLVAGMMLFVRALRVSTMTDFAAAAFALVVLTGLHTFRGNVREAFPINHFLEIAVFCLLTLNLALMRPGMVIDALAAVIFVVASLTLESGLLVWVVAVSAWVVGWRGISSRGVALMTILLAGYLYLRFVYLATGMPTAAGRSSGFLFQMLDPPDVDRLFGANPLWFYVYNIGASVGSVLFSEPQSGVFRAIGDWLAGSPRLLRVMLPVVTSGITTMVLVWAAMRRLSGPRQWDDTGRHIAVFAAVLIGSAALSYKYTKDEIMSTAGIFYALAAFAAVRELLPFAARLRLPAGIAIALLLGTLSLAWSTRSAGLHYVLRSQAAKHQMDWVVLPGVWHRAGLWPDTPAEQRLITQLRSDAVERSIPNTRARGPRWVDLLWME